MLPTLPSGVSTLFVRRHAVDVSTGVLQHDIQFTDFFISCRRPIRVPLCVGVPPANGNGE